MNKEKALMQLKDLLYNFKNYKKVDSTKDDVQALEYAIKEIESDIPTKDLGEELSKREGVKVDIADPHKDVDIKVNGPAIVLTVID
jgi:Na+/phosphate symporter